MTTVDLTLKELCIAALLIWAFAITWAEDKHRINTERARRRWLQRHTIDRGRVAKWR